MSRRSHVTGFQPLPTGAAEHESALERDFVTLTSWRDAGAAITAQPITLRFEHERAPRRYTPDFLVQRFRETNPIRLAKTRSREAFWGHRR